MATGRIFDSGRALAPFAKIDAYEALGAFPGAYEPPPPVEPEFEQSLPFTGVPQTWSAIAVGALVLASSGDEGPWYEAIVVEAKDDDLLVLKWRHWPDHGAIIRRPNSLALLPATA